MKALYVTDWDRLYEVNSSGGRWMEGQKKRAGPLPFARWYVNGPSGNKMAYREAVANVKEKYGGAAWLSALGVFAEALEIAAARDAEFRGYLLGRNHSPISLNLFATIAGFTVSQVERGLKILADPIVGWLVERELPVSVSGEPDSRNDPAIPGISPEDSRNELNPLIKPIQTNTNQYKPKEPMLRAPFQKIITAYNAVCPQTGLPKALGSDKQRAKVAVRWKEQLFRDRYEEVFAKCAASTFMHHKDGEEKGWQVNFGWLIDKEDNYVKVLEGRYDDPEDAKPTPAKSRLRAALECEDNDTIECYIRKAEALPQMRNMSRARITEEAALLWQMDGLANKEKPDG